MEVAEQGVVDGTADAAQEVSVHASDLASADIEGMAAAAAAVAVAVVAGTEVLGEVGLVAAVGEVAQIAGGLVRQRIRGLRCRRGS